MSLNINWSAACGLVQYSIQGVADGAIRFWISKASEGLWDLINLTVNWSVSRSNSLSLFGASVSAMNMVILSFIKLVR